MANTTLNFSERVRSVLEQNFPGSQVTLDNDDGEERLGGFIVWDGFDDQEMIERQYAIFGVLRKDLGADSRRISLILTYTPREWEIMSAA